MRIFLMLFLLTMLSCQKDKKSAAGRILKEQTLEDKVLEIVKDPAYLELTKPLIKSLREIPEIDMKDAKAMEAWWERYTISQDCTSLLMFVIKSDDSVNDIATLRNFIEKQIFNTASKANYKVDFVNYFAPRIVSTKNNLELLMKISTYCEVREDYVHEIQDKFFKFMNINPLSRKKYKKYLRKYPEEIRSFYEVYKDDPFYSN